MGHGKECETRKTVKMNERSSQRFNLVQRLTTQHAAKTSRLVIRRQKKGSPRSQRQWGGGGEKGTRCGELHLKASVTGKTIKNEKNVLRKKKTRQQCGDEGGFWGNTRAGEKETKKLNECRERTWGEQGKEQGVPTKRGKGGATKEGSIPRWLGDGGAMVGRENSERRKPRLAKGKTNSRVGWSLK